MPNSAQFMDDLGPLAAIWAGRDQGIQENTSLVNQQNTLEQIATAQQNRDIASQKLPFELSELRHKQAMQPGALEKQGLENKEKLQKLNKDQFDTFFGQFKDVLPTLQGTPADAAVLGEIARKNGIDPQDPRIGKMIATATSGNHAAIDEMMKRIALMSEKSIQERAKQADVDKAHGERTTAEIAGRERVAEITGKYSLERAEIIAEAKSQATQRLANIDQRLVQLAQVINNPQADPAEKAKAQQEAAQLSQYKIALATAVNQQKVDQIQQLLGLPVGNTPTAANPFAGGQPQPTPAPARPVNPAQGGSSMPPGFDNQPAVPPAKLQGPAAEDWIKRAMQANPKMTREQIIAEGQRKGKL